jgi:hypothetical protein
VKPYKIGGLCSLCEAPCFEIMAVWDKGEKNEGEPKRLGPPMNDSERITFLLFDGRRTDMTVCGACAESLTAEQYALLWRKNLAGYMREQDGNPEKFKHQFVNGILCELNRTTWKELAYGREP